MNFLITAGATREYIDPVRFISNPSSGKMGIAIAEEAKRKHHKVRLIAGYCAVSMPKQFPIVKAETAGKMRKAVLQYINWADILIMAAAVGDWKIQRKSRQKIKKEDKILTLKLIPNPDILAEVGRLRKRSKKIFLVGFSVDTKSLLENAKKKLKRKYIDMIVVNSPSTFGSVKIKAVIINRGNNIARLPEITKKQFAKKLVKIIEKSKANQESAARPLKSYSKK